MIAPHLLEHLMVGNEGGEWLRPQGLITALMVVAALGVAGPTWEREVPPFAEDTAPLVIALEMSMTMNATDVQPTRLERGKQKIRDLLERRSGARTALIAYAGSAHSVLPLSDDSSLFETFLDALATEVMPVNGNDPVAALRLAEGVLGRETEAGSILFITDGISSEAAPSFAEHQRESDDEILVLAVGTSAGGPIRLDETRFATDANGQRIMASLDREGLQALEAAGIFVTSTTVDDADISRVERRVQSNLRRVEQENPSGRWRDFGYFFAIPAVLLGLVWFRRGWTVRWNVVGIAFVLVFLQACSADFWLTHDQQGRRLFEQGAYAEAAAVFDDPLWRGAAHYRAGNLTDAVNAWALDTSPEAYYNLGNAYALLGNYVEAVNSYDQALAARPAWVEARENRDLVQATIDDQPEPESQQQGGEPTFEADQIEFDEKGEQGERGEVQMDAFTDEQMTEMWMRRLQTSPADFLRNRFAIEAADTAEGAGGSS
jgi:Ca-activated chloride channel family protein